MPEHSTSVTDPSSLSLAEMLRIMDVATEMRKQRETVEKEFAVEDTKRMLRDKLLRTTAITGEPVTEAEVNAAIDAYFSTLYTYKDPPFSWSVLMARMYVRRTRLAIAGAVLLPLAGGGYWMLHQTARSITHAAQTGRNAVQSKQVSPPDKTTEAVSQPTAILDNLMAKARTIAREPAVIDDLGQWQREIATARPQLDASELKSMEARLTLLISRLSETYELRIRSDPEQASGFERLFDQTHPAYYVVVSARNERGEAIRQSIQDAETNQRFNAEFWGEQVPKDVFDRLVADKKSDGILNETLFGVKERGYRNLDLKLPGSDGKPIARGAQIAW